MTRPQRKRRVAERVRQVGAAELAAARVRQLDALEADTHELQDTAPSDDEYVPMADGRGSDNDDDLDVLRIGRGGGDGPGATEDDRSKQGRGKRVRRGTRGVRASKNTVGIEKWNKPLQQALDEDIARGLVKEGDAESYSSIAARPSFRPSRKLCSVCGFEAPYTCSRCAVRFCSVRCGSVHEETRCLKFTL
jgi:zinc finger HIT domain-containing protein 1